jgi:hypothetical protein
MWWARLLPLEPGRERQRDRDERANGDCETPLAGDEILDHLGGSDPADKSAVHHAFMRWTLRLGSIGPGTTDPMVLVPISHQYHESPGTHP